MNELRDVPGFPGYRVSLDGDVWCFNPPHSERGRWMKPYRHHDGLSVTLACAGKTCRRRPARLVQLAWFTARPKLPWPPRHDAPEDAGPFALGSANTHALLSEDDVRALRRLRAQDPRRWSYSALARQFEVSRSTIFHALAGLTWSHVEPMPMRRHGKGGNARLTAPAIAQIRQRHGDDPARWTKSALARHYGVSVSTIRQALGLSPKA